MAATEEKEDALNQVEAHKQAAIAAINQAQSTQQVSEAKNNGINTINQDQPNAVKKNNTKTILEQKETRKKSAIAQTPDATTEEKQKLSVLFRKLLPMALPISTKQILMMMLIKNLVMQNKLLLILMSMFKNLKPDKH